MKDLIQIMAVFAVILTIIPTIVFLRPNESASKPAFSEKEKIEVIDALIKVYNSFLSGKIDDYNSSVYYENPSYLFECYEENKIL